MALELHPDLTVLAPLLGTWQGPGEGEYPTIDSFGYLESVTFGHVGKPFLSYQQKTRDSVTGLPMHAETGYWRVPSRGRLEIVLAQPTGFAEVYEGTIAAVNDALIMDVKSTSIGSTTSAKDVSRTERTFELEGDELRYTFRMAAVGQPLQHHLSATLHRTVPEA